MKRNFSKLYMGLAALAFVFMGTSCSDDDNGPSYSTGTVDNTALRAVLTEKGYTFSEDGKLLLNDLALNTTALDLSGTNLDTAALRGLSILPNLKEVSLANNGYGKTFDFNVLPAQITGVDLTGNEIYDYDNLSSVEENGDISDTRTMTKLYLPNEAKNNCTDLMYFYTANKEAIANGTVDMKMSDENGTLNTYNTFRDVPNEALRNTLKASFAGLFEGDQIDISKYLPLDQQTEGIQVMDDVSDFEGIQYIIQHPSWKGSSIILYSLASSSNAPCFKPNSAVSSITIYNVGLSAGIDWSDATGVRVVMLTNVKGVKDVDLSRSTIFGQRDMETESDPFTGSALFFVDCPDLEEVLLPSKSGLKVSAVALECLSSLKTLDLTKFDGIADIYLGDLPDSYKLVYPTLVEFPSMYDGKTNFACSKYIYDKAETKAFIQKYYTDANPKRLQQNTMLNSSNNANGGTDGVQWAK